MKKKIDMQNVDIEKPLTWLRRYARENDVQYADLFISEDGTAIIRCTLIDVQDGKAVYSYKIRGEAENIVEFYDIVEKVYQDGRPAHKKIELSKSECSIRLEALKRRGGVKAEALRLSTAITEGYQADGGGVFLRRQRLIPFHRREQK